MPKELKVSIGHYSAAGRKDINQDALGSFVPKESRIHSKGIAIALADGISSSQVSQIASQSAIRSFLEDYFCTSDAWTVKKAAHCVLSAINSWLYAQSRQSQFRYDMDKGYVCTFSALILKSTTAHLFHVGDSRIYRVRDKSLEQLSQDHRLWVSSEKSYLSRALGSQAQLEIDYLNLPLEIGDTFFLATDGIYEFTSPPQITQFIQAHPHDLDLAARLIAEAALAQGSDDNLSCQILRIDSLPEHTASEVLQQAINLSLPPLLEARMSFDGYKIIREIHASSRSHVYLAQDEESGEQCVIKIPSIDLRGDPAYLERFLMEDWIARRLNSPHVLKAHPSKRKQNYLYTVTEYIEGQTLTQWMHDHPKPDLESVRKIIEQTAKGLRAFHRMEMLHQDLRPENIMIDTTGTVKIIDFGSTRVAGVLESNTAAAPETILGTVQYTAPEYFVGDPTGPQSDLFSLGVIAYQMLSGDLPYGAAVAQIRTCSALQKLIYRPFSYQHRHIPSWIDDAIRKAVHPEPHKRYEDPSEFLFDLRHPNQSFLSKARPPLLERNPLLFWKCSTLLLSGIILFLLARGA